MRLIPFIMLTMLVSASSPHVFAGTPQAQQMQLATLHGRVVDARTGEAIAKVKVIASGTDQSTTTDEKGAFTLDHLPAGKIDLYITTITFGLVKKTITVKEGDNVDLQIALNEDAAALTERVTVGPSPYESASATVASEQSLNKRELQELSSVLVGDPIRAVQALPAVIANDDYRIEFAVRGAGFDRVGLYLDGVLTESLVHTIAGGYRDTGSLSLINADTVNSVSVMSGAFPSQYGQHSAAILEIQTRDGNRVKPTGRFAASLTALSAVTDGPFDKGRGSYLFAGRKSYAGYLIRKFNNRFHYTDNPPIVDFADFQAKALYDLNQLNQIGFSLIYGDFSFDRDQDRNLLGINEVFRGNTRHLLLNGHWSYSPKPNLFWQTRVFGLRTTFNNINRLEKTLEDGRRSQFGMRSDVSYQAASRHRLELGLYLRRLHVDSVSQRFSGTVASNAGSYTRDALEQSS